MDFSLTGGVLIIGSLLWDTDELRDNWRRTCLDIDNGLHVPAPIRYGRESTERHCTFSMVFSTECNTADQQGKAFFVPFRNNPISLKEIQFHATELIKAEYKKKTLDFDRHNWSWGALAIAINPKNLDKASEKHAQTKILLDFWGERYGNAFNPDDYKIGQEIPAVNKQGILSFQWVNELNDFDFVIATATKPNRNIYPTSKNISDRIIVNEYSEYFDKNVAHGITTYQDGEIKALLGR